MDYRMPLYMQLKEIIIKRIEDGEYLPGEKIPSEREMADTYGVNRMTVKNAISSLVEANILYRVHGKGTFVAKKETENYTDTGRGLGAVLKDSGKPLTNQTLEKGVIQCRGYLANKLHILKNDDVYVLHRLRSMGTESFALEYCYVPFRLFEDIDSYNFEHVSLYDYMKSKGHLPVVFSQRLTILKAVQPFRKDSHYITLNISEKMLKVMLLNTRKAMFAAIKQNLHFELKDRSETMYLFLLFFYQRFMIYQVKNSIVKL